MVDVSELKSSPLFENLSKKQLALIARHADEVALPAGRVVMREGEMAWEVCVILEGAARVTSGEKVLAELGPGAVFGEIGVVAGLHRTATVTAVTDMRVAVMFGPEFTGVSEEIEELKQMIARLIEERLARGGGDPT